MSPKTTPIAPIASVGSVSWGACSEGESAIPSIYARTQGTATNFTVSLCFRPTSPWNLNALLRQIGSVETTVEVAVKTILNRMQQGERVWSAEIVLRLSGFALLGMCRLAMVWLLRVARFVPPHNAAPAALAVAAAGFVCLTTGLALLFEGPGLLRLQPRPPRALLP